MEADPYQTMVRGFLPGFAAKRRAAAARHRAANPPPFRRAGSTMSKCGEGVARARSWPVATFGPMITVWISSVRTALPTGRAVGQHRERRGPMKHVPLLCSLLCVSSACEGWHSVALSEAQDAGHARIVATSFGSDWMSPGGGNWHPTERRFARLPHGVSDFDQCGLVIVSERPAGRSAAILLFDVKRGSPVIEPARPLWGRLGMFILADARSRK